MNLEELRHLNPRDPGGWPGVVKVVALLALLALIIGGGYWYVWQDQFDTLEAREAEELKLKETYLAKKKEAVNLDIYKQQLADIEQTFGAMLKQLPNKAEMDALITDINQAGLGRGLQFDLFKPAPRETTHDFYAELPIAVKVTGNYHDMGAFASDVAQLPRIVTLNNIAIETAKEGLVLNAVAKTYRYLDDAEVAAQRKAQQAAKGGKK
ncbi:MAG TPA: type 4a pilus biogenesis protein PilO [Pelomicrobium sp.]|nr:type 4a pilus biogenesis protein PilO [Pelomicrobium sp.]